MAAENIDHSSTKVTNSQCSQTAVHYKSEKSTLASVGVF
jgi:hypothetical protein